MFVCQYVVNEGWQDTTPLGPDSTDCGSNNF